jgi:hypothetical protein
VDLIAGTLTTGFGVDVERDGVGSGAGREVVFEVVGVVSTFTGVVTLDWSPTDEVTRRPGFTITGSLVTGVLVTLTLVLPLTRDGVTEGVDAVSATG